MPESDTPLKRTALFDRHTAHGGRIVPFAGWEMPVQYEGILAEHRRVRSAAGLFDLGHMGQVAFTGPGALDFIQYATTSDVGALERGQARYGLIPNDDGGVVDDIIVYRQPEGQDGYLIVVNASNTEKDVAWWNQIRERRPNLDVNITNRSAELSMIAIQGPRAVEITGRITDTPVNDLSYFSWSDATVGGVPCKLARTGYTGEDGFEFYAPNDAIGDIWDGLLNAGSDDGLAPIGLGARDTLRLEARMPLYGQELADDISPYEAGLGWAVNLDKGDFVGREAMLRVKEQGAPRRTVGFVTTARGAAPRTGCEVVHDSQQVGLVTSGSFSPTLEQNIGLALVARPVAGVGKPLQIIVRGKPVEAVQVKTPFYKRAQ